MTPWQQVSLVTASVVALVSLALTVASPNSLRRSIAGLVFFIAVTVVVLETVAVLHGLR